MSKSIYPSIPAPGTDANSQRATLDAMRQALTMVIMNAQQPNPNFSPSSASQIFVTQEQLKATGVVGPKGETGAPGPPGVGIVEAPSDANTYGRHALTWLPVLTDAPHDGKTYGRKNGAWVDVGTVHYVRVRTVSGTLNNAVANGGILQFDTVDFDTDGFSPGTSTFDHITIPAGLDGVFIFAATSSSSGNQATSMGMGLLKNGTQIFSETNQLITGPGSVNYTFDNTATEILKLVAGDTIQLRNNSVSSGANVFTSTLMAVARIGS